MVWILSSTIIFIVKSPPICLASPSRLQEKFFFWSWFHFLYTLLFHTCSSALLVFALVTLIAFARCLRFCTIYCSVSVSLTLSLLHYLSCSIVLSAELQCCDRTTTNTNKPESMNNMKAILIIFIFFYFFFFAENNNKIKSKDVESRFWTIPPPISDICWIDYKINLM